MSETPKHASGKTDFELVEAAIDVAVNGADLHEDDEECPQDDTCECRDAATVNDGHRALVRMDRDISSLREQVRALTAERNEARKQSEQYAAALMDAGEALGVRAVSATTVATEARALRARVAEMEKERAEDQGVIRVWRGRTERAESERDAAQQRAKAVEGAVRRVTREALEALEKMPTPTKEYEALATLQRNLLQRLREETDAAMAAATTNTEAP